MEYSEAGLELLVKKLNGVIEAQLSKLSPFEIVALQKKIPEIKSMLDYRSKRDSFLLKFNDPYPIPNAKTFAEEIINSPTKDCEIPADSRQTLLDFFSNEIVRVTKLKNIVEKRCENIEIVMQTHPLILIFLESVSKYIEQCQESLSRLQCTQITNLTTTDLQFELEATFCARNRKAMYEVLLSTLRTFPITIRDQIYNRLFDLVQKFHVNYSTHEPIIYYPIDEATVDTFLIKYANFFQLDSNINSADGQGFLYITDKNLKKYFKLLDYMTYPVQEIEINKRQIPPNMDLLTQDAGISETTIDIELQNVFKRFTYKENEIDAYFVEQTNNYNNRVGNTVKGVVKRNVIATHKISAWFKLRFTREKYLLMCCLAMINYFEYVKYYLQDSYNRDYTISCNPNLEHIITINYKGQPILFKSAVDEFETFKNYLVLIGSYYTENAEHKLIEENKKEIPIINRDAMVENLLDMNFRYFMAKRNLVQIFMEVFEHTHSDAIAQIIYEIASEKPVLNLPLHKTYEAPYEKEINLLEAKAKVLRFLLNMQILQERNFSYQMKGTIPLFDRPILIPDCGLLHRSFVEAIPTSIFEVYFSLEKLSEFYQIVPNLARDFDEAIGIRHSKFHVYTELAIWNEFNDLILNLTKKGFFPYDQSSVEFNFPLSESVGSLFTSFFVNKFDYGNSLITNMNESRKLRFMVSMRRFYLYAWHLQTSVIRTDIMQNAYFNQCKSLGITDIGVLMNPFMEVSNAEVIDLDAPTMSNTIQFAYTEFENANIDFSNELFVKDIIFAADFEILKRLIIFQQMQNTILELAVRYNSFILDARQIVNHFQLAEDYDIFMTGSVSQDNVPERQILHQIATKLFYNPSSIYRDYKIASENINSYILSVHTTKSKSRTILSAHAKQKSMSTTELLDLYSSEMLDAFAPFAYRIEIARICKLEEYYLTVNSFADTYVLGPDNSQEMIGEDGHFSRFMFIPTWVETFKMLQNSPHARQSMVLKSLLQYITARFRIFCIVREESSLQMRTSQVLTTMYFENFKLETPMFQLIRSKLESMPDSREVEISAKYMCDFERLFFLRFEYAVLTSLEQFYISSNLDLQGQRVADTEFGEKLKNLWLLMHNEQESTSGLISSLRYVPNWEKEFCYTCFESDRDELHTRLQMVDKYVCDSINVRSCFDNIAGATDFLSLSITQMHMKFAFFLLLKNFDANLLDTRESVRQMNLSIFSSGLNEWNELIVKKAIEHLAPKDASASRLIQSVPETKLAQAIFDVVRNHIDLMLLTEQINELNKEIDDLSNLEIPDKPPGTEKLDIPDINLSDEPQIIDKKFNDEFEYKLAKLVNLNKIVSEEATTIVNNQQVFDATVFEEKALSFSHQLRQFAKISIDQITQNWNKYIKHSSSEIEENNSILRTVDTVAELASTRFTRQVDATIGTEIHDGFIELNTFRNAVCALEQQYQNQESEIREDTKNDFDRLINDLKQQLFLRKNNFTGVKRRVYNDVFKKINSAKEVAMNMNQSNQSNESDEERKNKADCEHKKILERIEHFNENMRKDIVKVRIMKVFGRIAVSRARQKDIEQAEEERKIANGQMWNKKLQAEDKEEKLRRDLLKAHSRLCETELEISKLSQQLDNEKMSNIQLVHWKAKNMKVVEKMNKKIKSFNDDSGIDIDSLVEKLDAATEELESLREETDSLEKEADVTVRRTISSLNTKRTQKKQMMAQSMRGIQSQSIKPEYNLEEIAQRLSDDNIRLRQENEDLAKQIEELESQKASKPQEVLQMMENVTKQRSMSRLSSQAKKKTIVKPNFTSKTIPRH
ncbi:hypothetical protein TVAG_415120 [Trichomonas vaginalis G3]|uniref:Uncharacterized protein n=1 Tax=Trichomonas vaginalis (strain ATCC PRA-98 / G3) TaxID=412133 RepID=A2FAJ5_TRIV3|nr:coiled-coil domain-containing protein 162 family [Trichomonas vaginalis G3]EAX98088.1 hypothetical protein TVAG_415120 [Trichomonas vaginalis G3]KAI5515631.1 coiled-coil domain-containing protein 162 family [Trichomonas vaginalis G3]|eukprot:XP_001311018.1 hypothetical protein [Trichomonas vaginalis G3]